MDDHELLFRNRRLRPRPLRAHGAGAVWVQGELPLAAVSAAEVDRLLGLLVQAAADARGATSSR